MLGPKFGYYPEESKSWLIVKEKAKQRAFTVFKDTAIKITTEGQRHLGAVIDSSKYKREYVQNKIDDLINEIKVLCMIARHKPSNIMRTIPDISDQLNQLDEVITSELIPAITGGMHCSNIERKLLPLPSKLEGAWYPNLRRNFKSRYEYSLMLSKDLSTRIMKQKIQLSSETDVQNIKQKIKSQNNKNIKQS